jgi:hypothetical protein
MNAQLACDILPADLPGFQAGGCLVSPPGYDYLGKNFDSG